MDVVYPRFVAATLADYRAGRPAPVGLEARVPVMAIVDAAYPAARSGSPVSVDIGGRRAGA